MRKRTSLTFLLAAWAATALPAAAFERPFPPHAKRGKMTPAPYPDIVINGKARRMTPASRIFNEDNLIVMPASLRGSNIVVNYAEDGDGDIERIWILDAFEARQTPPPATPPPPKPATPAPQPVK